MSKGAPMEFEVVGKSSSIVLKIGAEVTINLEKLATCTRLNDRDRALLKTYANKRPILFQGVSESGFAFRVRTLGHKKDHIVFLEKEDVVAAISRAA